MSWVISAAGAGRTVADSVAAQCESNKKYSQGKLHDNVMNALEDTARVLTSEFPDHICVFESSGHLDPNGGYGNATLNFKVYPKPREESRAEKTEESVGPGNPAEEG